jgi:hypothetical protein
VGDTPYFINENNVDRYPLMNPVDIQEVPTELPEDTTLPDQQQVSAGKGLTTEYTFAAIAFVGIAAASAYLFLNRKKPTAKTKTSIT